MIWSYGTFAIQKNFFLRAIHSEEYFHPNHPVKFQTAPLTSPPDKKITGHQISPMPGTLAKWRSGRDSNPRSLATLTI